MGPELVFAEASLCARKRAECFYLHDTPLCSPSTWGGGVYSYTPILKIKKLRPEVTGVGHELRRTALAGDALLHPRGLSGLDLHPGGTQRVRGELRG